MKHTKPKHNSPINSKAVSASYSFYFAIAGILILTCIVFYPSINNGFTNWDDPHYILQNNLIKKLNILNTAIFFSEFFLGNYHPLTLLSFSIDYFFYQDSATGYHIVNLLFHLSNTILVIVFFYLLVKNKFISLMVGLLFAIHPLHVESVAWISERKDVLYAFFYLFAMIFYIKYTDSSRKTGFYILSLFFFILSALSKSMAVTLPLILLLIDYFKYKKITLKNVTVKIPFLIVSLVFGILAILAQRSANAILNDMSYSFTDRFLLVCNGFTDYLIKLVYPLNLSAFYPYPLKINNTLPLYYWLYPLTPLLFIVVLYYCWKKKLHSIIFGLLFFISCIFPVLQILPVGDAIMADRYMYLPSLGLFFILCNELKLVLQKSPSLKIIALGLVFLYILCLSYLSRKRCEIWKDSIVLWTDVINQYPYFVKGYFDRANEYAQNGNFDKAITDLDKAIKFKPDHSKAYNNRGFGWYKKGNYDLALKDFIKSLTLDSTNVDGLNNMGVIYFERKEFRNAEKYLKKIIAINPNFGNAYGNLGAVYHNMGDFKNAIVYYEMSLKFNHNNKNIVGYLSNIYQMIGDTNKANEYSRLLKE